MLSEILRDKSFTDEAVAYAIDRNPGLLEINRERICQLARRAAREVAFFEEIARTGTLRTPSTSEEAKRIKAIWDLSGVGTCLKESQEDRWKDITWAAGTDRRRLNYSGALMRRLTERITGVSYGALTGRRLTMQQIEGLKADIERSGPYLIYGSTLEQNQDVETVLANDVIIPRSKVHIISFPQKPVRVNTIDQMKTFSLPSDLKINEGDILVIVAHAPHMMRALHLMNRFRPLPKDLILQPHPLSSPSSAGTDYAKQEISGFLYYTLITGDSAEDSYPFQV